MPQGATYNRATYGERRLVINLNAEQTPIYLETEQMLKRVLGEEATRGEVVRELCRHFWFVKPRTISPTILELVDDHASNNNDPTFSLGELEMMDAHRLRQYAAQSRTEELNGKSTRLEMYGYFLDLDGIDHPPEEANGTQE